MGEKAKLHPCLSCGACCAFFRVEFYWREANQEDTEKAVPLQLCEEASANKRAMRGTTRKHRPCCVALAGKIGEDVRCTIYENRSSACRSFMASYENGRQNPRCDEARRAHGLSPLRREDWTSPYLDAGRRRRSLSNL